MKEPGAERPVRWMVAFCSLVARCRPVVGIFDEWAGEYFEGTVAVAGTQTHKFSYIMHKEITQTGHV